MNWPNIGEYNEAIQNPHHNLGEEELRAGHVATNTLGIPLSWSGQFAVVYKIDCPATGKTWALKCFTRDIPNIQQRYQALSEHLENVRLNYKVPFRYLQNGIRVGGKWYPAVKMQWVESTRLDDFLEKNLDNEAALSWLLKTWPKLAERLAACDIAHGDLQHGNVLIQDGFGRRRLRLVDYDGMCVPKLVGLRSHEKGHAAFQHPQRQEGTYGLDVDRFSHLVIYTTLYCLRIGGEQLWSRFHNGDNLLFTEKDFKEPARSELFRQLWQLDEDDATALVGRLALACVQPIESVPSLCEIVTPKGIYPLTASEYRQVGDIIKTHRAARNVFPVIRVHSGLGALVVQQVQQAKAGQEIVLEPGVYLLPRSLKLDKPVEIVGCQGAERTIIHYTGEGPAIIYAAGGMLTLKGLSLERIGGSGALFHATTGTINIEDCRFHGAADAPGILLAGPVWGKISRCHISHNKGDGIRLKDRARVCLEKNICERNGDTGIAYYGASAGTASNNTCRENKQHGIYLGERAAPTLQENTCERNEWRGIACFGSSSGTALKNSCCENKYDGILLQQRAAPTLEQNTCEKNEWSGIAYYDSSGGTARNNTCRENKHYGIYAQDQASPTLQENTCERNESCGIAYFGSSGGKAQNNTCRVNKQYGIYVTDQARAMLEKNDCQRNECSGIAYLGTSGGTARNNTCRENKKNGFYIAGRAVPTLDHNTCERNEWSGIAYSGASGGTASNNICRQNKKNGIQPDGQAAPTLEANVCEANAEAGIAYYGFSRGTAGNNNCRENNQHGICVSGQAAPVLENNTCERNDWSGIAYGGYASGKASNNCCRDNKCNGIYVTGKANPLLNANSCTGNRWQAVWDYRAEQAF